MRHPTFAELRSFAAAEAAPRGRRRTSAHLARCPRCRELVTWTREVTMAAAEATALPAPAGSWERIAARLAAGETVLLPTDGEAMISDQAGVPRWHRSPALRAALLVLVLAGVASATVPGSPLRAWIGRVLPFPAAGSEAGVASDADDPAAAAPGTGASVTRPDARIVVPLVDDALTIRIERPHPDLRIRVRVGGEPEVLVHASGGAAEGRFRRAAGRLTIEEAGEGEVVIGIPAGPGRVSLEVDGRLFLLKGAGQLQILAPAADTIGSEFVFTTRRGDAPERP